MNGRYGGTLPRLALAIALTACGTTPALDADAPATDATTPAPDTHAPPGGDAGTAPFDDAVTVPPDDAALFDDGGTRADAATPPGAFRLPQGVPMPSFGITETAAAPTCYVDNTNPAATDTSNPNGTPARPRRTVPATLPAGAVVEVRGGPYDATHISWTGSGTATAPVIVRGVDMPVFRGAVSTLTVSGPYVLIEGLVFDSVAVILAGPHHQALRGNEIRNFTPAGNASAIGFGGTDFVVYRNHIHHNGDASSTAEHDVHAMKASTGTSNLWILENDVHHNGGDSVQLGDAAAPEPWVHHVYIGRNRLHEDRENAVDVKKARDVLVSQNECFGYEPTSSDEGSAFVVHDGAERVWLMFNHVHDSAIGISNTGSVSSFIVGNLIRAIHHPAGGAYDPTSLYGPGTAIRAYGSDYVFVVNNTLLDVDKGISFPASGATQQRHVANNIIAGLATPSYHLAVETSTTAAVSMLTANLFAPVARVRWGNSTVLDLAGLRAAYATQCTGCLEGDPGFASATDPRLRAGSAAVDRGVDYPLYAAFEMGYHLSIRQDLLGTPRPTGAAFDLGAFEYAAP